MSGRGTLHNYVVYHKAWTKWFESRVPYAVVQVQLEEGPRLTANLLDCDLKGELNARELYTKARDLCRDANDYVTMKLFESLLDDEEEHIDFLETQLDLMSKIGEQNYGVLQSGSANDGHGKD